MKDVLRTKDLAKLVGVNNLTILRWIQKGFGPAYRRNPKGNLILFDRADVEKWLSNQKVSEGQAV